MVTLVRPYKKLEDNNSLFPSFDSVEDIGKKIKRKSVTASHYLTYERFCANTILNFLLNSNHPTQIKGLENARSALSDNKKLELKFGLDKVLIKKMPLDQFNLVPAELSDVVRLIIRECMWARLYNGRRVVHFGWDSYIYFAGASIGQVYANEFVRIGRVVQKVSRLPIILPI